MKVPKNRKARIFHLEETEPSDLDLNREGKIGFAPPEHNEEGKVVKIKEKEINFSNQRNTTLQKIIFVFIIIATLATIVSYLALFIKVRIETEEWVFNSISLYPYFAFLALGLEIVTIALCIYDLTKKDKKITSYLVISSVLLIAVVVCIIIYYINGFSFLI